MRHEAAYRARCAARGLGGEDIAAAVAAVEDLEAFALAEGLEPGLEAAERRLAGLVARDGIARDGTAGKGIAGGGVPEGLILALARYFLVAGDTAASIRLLAYLLPVGVLPAMGERLAALEGETVRDRVMSGIACPPPGSRPEAYPPATAAFVRALEAELGPSRAARVLRWNVHGVPAAAFAAEREAWLAAPSTEAWLEGHHARQVATLERHAADGSLWYEQLITPRVVEFVRANPEVLGGVVEGGRILVTKIPYDPDRWLTSGDPLERRRLACHCPLAASAIEAVGAPGAAERGVPATWCACSAGFEKFMFDVVFGEDTEAEVLESVLAGSERCRFAVTIPEKARAKAG